MYSMQLKKISSDRRSGFALLQVLMLMAVMSLTVPIIFSMLTDSSKRQKQRGHREKFITFVQSMKFKLEDPMICSQLLNGVRVNQLQNTFGKSNAQLEAIMYKQKTDVTLNTDYGDVKGPIQKNWDASMTTEKGSGEKMVGESFKISEIFITPSRDEGYRRYEYKVDKDGNPIIDPKTGKQKKELKPIGPYNTVRPWGTTLELESVPIRVYFRSSDTTVGAAIVNGEAASGTTESVPLLQRNELQISLIANINPTTRQIQSCFGINSQAATCEYNGGVYDLRPVVPIPPNPATEDNLETAAHLRCKPDKRCFNDIQGLINKPNCPFPYKPKFVGCLPKGAGKGTEAKFLCSWCHKDCIGKSCPKTPAPAPPTPCP